MTSMYWFKNRIAAGLLALGGAVVFAVVSVAAATQAPAVNSVPVAAPSAEDAVAEVVNSYCLTCHNERMQRGGLDLESLDVEHVGANAALWEKVIKKMRVGAMPPAGGRRPDAATYASFIASLEGALDAAVEDAPNPGRPPVHRLNRLQYTNAIRDLFGLEIDGRTMLPADDTGFGFDNIGDVLTLSPSLLDRYLLAASKISRLAVGDASMRAGQATYSVPLSLGQDVRLSEDQPFGSRGGIALRHYFPVDGEYSVTVTLQRSDLAAGYRIRGLAAPNEIAVRLGRELLTTFTIGGDRGEVSFGANYAPEEEKPDEAFVVRFPATAGTHVVGVSLNVDRWDVEGVGLSRLPLTSSTYSMGMNTSPNHGRIDAGIDKIDIRGPFEAELSPESGVRQRVFVCQPANDADEEPCATRILSKLARRAFRRPVTGEEVGTLVEFFRRGRSEGGSFDYGIRTALARLLMDVNFLFQIEQDPDGAQPGEPYRVSDLELASRLSLFLWSSIPDDELLDLAERGELEDPDVLNQQVRRMLRDERSSTLIESFFGQWLTVRNMSAVTPDPKVFPEFDENLRDAFQREMVLFLESQVREDRSAVDLLTADYTFVNERLARHYGIPGVAGSHFRRVQLPDAARAGLLGKGGVLTVTSYNDRTSVVMRGKWVMENILGTPPPPAPPNVPALEQTQIHGTLRQRMEQHRRNPVCAACHSKMDPLGFALENFDGIGAFRTVDGGAAVDPSGTMLNGAVFDGPGEFKQLLVSHQDAFLATMTEKLVTYALGRGVEAYDMPAVRQILREASDEDYRWSAILSAVARSVPFQMRRAVS